MNKKIVGIFIVMLLLITVVVPGGEVTINNVFDLSFPECSILKTHRIFKTNFFMGDWLEQAKLQASDGEPIDRLGFSVALEGDYAVMGAHGDDGYKGAVYIFKRYGTAWNQEAKLNASDGETMDGFGVSVAIDGNYVIVGAMYDSNINGYRAGAVYVFKYSGTTWTEEAKLIASDGAANDYLGYRISIDEDRIIAGADGEDENGDRSGAAYIFKRSGSSWTQEVKLTASDGEDLDIYGCCYIQGNYAIVGANQDDNENGVGAGAAYVYKFTGEEWVEEVKLMASDGEADDFFGFPVKIDGDYIFISAGGDDNINGVDAGAVYIFKKIDSEWVEDTKLIASDGLGSYYGNSISISGESLIIGSPYTDNNGFWSGSAYIYKRYYTAWIEEEIIIPSDGADYDMFGFSCSISGEYVLASAWWDDDQTGSAYVFKRSYTPIKINIRPDDYPNIINPKSKGRIPIAILTNDDFDTSNVDIDTILFLGAIPVISNINDVDSDGDDDLLLFFDIKDLNLDLLEYIEGQESPFATLTAETSNGMLIKGKDTVKLVGQTFLQQILKGFLEKLIYRFPLFEKILNQIKL